MRAFNVRGSVASVLAGALLVALAMTPPGCDRAKSKPPKQAKLPSSDEELRQMLDDVIEHGYYHRHLNTREHAAWQILHGALAYGRAFLMRDDEGRLVRAVDYLLEGGRMKGWRMQPGERNLPGGRRGLSAVMEQGTGTGQGHADQWLAVLAQCNLTPEQTIKVRGEEFTIADFLAQSQWDVYDSQKTADEWSWTLIGLTTYWPLDKEWEAAGGECSLERLMQFEAGEQFDHVRAAACGGTHRLIGMTMALNRYIEKQGDPAQDATDGWGVARDRVDEAVKLSKAYQQSDGSFSQEYFFRASHSQDLEERLGTTGHTLEFLTLALTDEQLKEDWVTRAVVHLCKVFNNTKDVDLECGKLYHAMHGLVLYRQRRFGPIDFESWAKKRLDAETTGEKRNATPVTKLDAKRDDEAIDPAPVP